MRKLGLLLGLAILFVGTISAQQKWGHLNSNNLLQAMPELKKVQAQITDYSKQLDVQNESMLAEYQAKRADFEENGETFVDAIQQAKIQELRDMEARITNFQNSASTKLTAKELELLKPVMDKVQQAIKTVSVDNGYTYIVDTSSGSILYWPEDSYNIMPLVKQQLGI